MDEEYYNEISNLEYKKENKIYKKIFNTFLFNFLESDFKDAVSNLSNNGADEGQNLYYDLQNIKLIITDKNIKEFYKIKSLYKFRDIDCDPEDAVELVSDITNEYLNSRHSEYCF